MAPIPSLLALSAVHHYLNDRAQAGSDRADRRNRRGARSDAYGVADRIRGQRRQSVYGLFAVLDRLVAQGDIQLDYETAEKHYVKALNKGLLKIISKMGISTIRSYRGAEIFEAVGLSDGLLKRYFRGMTSKIGGADLEDLAVDTLAAHAHGFGELYDEDAPLENFGNYAYRKDGERHAWNPETISTLQLATRLGSYQEIQGVYATCQRKNRRRCFCCDLMELKRNPIDLSLVEPATEIMKRFVTGAMSFGSLSREAHEAIAIAMNKIGGKSNTGEGGEDAQRYRPNTDGTIARSAIKQVASGRFGVHAEYLVNADEIQIKVAQGAKPGEGGQLPGYKVDEMIARTRHSIPGISLISPPPHHDIYSIEDLAQLIFDLKNVNPRARISVKLVSESGIGTIAAGVAKAKADMILSAAAKAVPEPVRSAR